MPGDWVQRSSTRSKGMRYWLNSASGETRWTRPGGAQTPRLSSARPSSSVPGGRGRRRRSSSGGDAAQGWVQQDSRTHPGLVFFHNTTTGETRWDAPPGVDARAIAAATAGGGGGGGGNNRREKAAMGGGALVRRRPASSSSSVRSAFATPRGGMAMRSRSRPPAAATALFSARGVSATPRGGGAAATAAAAAAASASAARLAAASGVPEERLSVSRQRVRDACMGPAAAAAMDPAVLRERLVLALRARALGNRFSSGKALVSKLLRAHDKSGTGSLDYASFGKALAATCNLVLGAPDMEGLFEYYANSSEGGGGGVDIDTLLGAALEDDYGDDRGIMDYPSGECGASSKNLRGRPDEIMMAIRNDLRRNFKGGKGLHKTPQAMFDAADASGNGAICLREFKVALRGPLSLGRGHDEALELLFRQCDADRSGEICFREFERHLLLVRPQDGLPKPDCQSMPLAAVRRVFKDNVTRVCQKKQCKGEVFDRQHFRALFEAGRGNAGVGWPVFRKVCEQILESIAPADVVKLYRSLQPLGLATPIPTHVLLQLVAPSDISGGRGILDYPSDDPGGGAPPSYPKMALIAIRTEVQKQIKATHGRSDRLLELFDRADADGTGSICRLAFKVALRGPHGHGSGHEAALDLLFDAADTNGNGVISFAEFSRELTRAVDNPDLSEGNQKMDLARLSTIFRDKLGEYSKRRGRWTAVANPDTIRRFFHELCPPSRKAGRNGRAPAEGAMSFATFLQICKHKLHINNVNDADLRELFRVFDRDNSGSIDCNEFLTAAFPADFTHEKGEMIWDEEVVSLGLVDEGHASVTQLALMRAQKAKASKPGHIDIGQRTVTPQMLSARRS